MGAATDLYDYAQDLLDFCVVALDELPAGAPARRYVTVGLPAIDCEQLTVHAFQVGEANTLPSDGMDTFRRGHPYPRLNLAWLVVTIIRDCWPVTRNQQQLPAPPAADDIAAASQVVYADGWQLWNAIRLGVEQGVIWPESAGCKFVGWQPLQPLGPAGATAGWTMPLQVQIDGFDPPPPV